MNRPSFGALLRGWMLPVIALLAANLIVFVAYTSPRWRSQRGIAGVVGGVQSARQRLEPRLQQARDTYGRVITAQRDLDVFYQDLITVGGASELMGMITDAAANAGILLDDASFQFVPVQELGIVQVGINVPVVGDYESVRVLLDELVELPVFLVVDGAGLSSILGNTAGGFDDKLRVELALSVFMEDAELAASGAQPTGAFAGSQLRGNVTLQDIQAAQRSDFEADADPEDLADALVARLTALPPLPVDAEALVLRLDKLERTRLIADPTRNLFAIVEPPPPPLVFEPQAEMVDPEPFLPVRLLGTMRVDGRWHASLADGDDLFVATTGDSLPNGVQVVEVGADYAEVRFGDDITRLILEG